MQRTLYAITLCTTLFPTICCSLARGEPSVEEQRLQRIEQKLDAISKALGIDGEAKPHAEVKDASHPVDASITNQSKYYLGKWISIDSGFKFEILSNGMVVTPKGNPTSFSFDSANGGNISVKGERGVCSYLVTPINDNKTYWKLLRGSRTCFSGLFERAI